MLEDSGIHIKDMSPGTTLWQGFMLALCSYVLIALAIETFFNLSNEVSVLLGYIDTMICCLFLLDFSYNIYSAENKWRYLRWGWLDFISSIPHVHFLRWGRFARLFRLVRLLRGARSVKFLIRYMYAKRALGTFLTVMYVCFMIVLISSIAILNIETTPDANIHTASDALWWSFLTLLTVGYGDKHPVTDIGKVLGSIVLIAGIGLVGTFTAFIASFFIEQDDKRIEEGEKNIMAELQEIHKRLENMESHTR